MNKSLLLLNPSILKKKVIKSIEWIDDSKLSVQITGVNFSVKEVKYHLTFMWTEGLNIRLKPNEK